VSVSGEDDGGEVYGFQVQALREAVVGAREESGMLRQEQFECSVKHFLRVCRERGLDPADFEAGFR
jgi:predicted HicB family RNase H-like nuclease